MAKVTSKLQVTVPKAIADRYGIRPGDDIEWAPAGGAIRVVPRSRKRGVDAKAPVATRLKLFDQATLRQRERQVSASPSERVQARGWSREELYDRGRPR